MKKDTFLPFIRGMGIILMFLWSLGIKAQTPNTAVLTWDQQVGCIRYEDDDVNEIPGNGEAPPQTQVNLFEGMMDGNCPRFCENSRVNFTLQGSTIASVQWQANGGTLQPGSTNSNAVVRWGSSGNGSLTVTITYNDNTVKTYTVCIEKILSPHAEFQINGPDPYQQVFCANNPISFNNLSHDNGGSSLVNYLWDFGDGNFSNAFEPTHTYTGGGAYNITLTVTNSCNCSSTYEYGVKVEDAKPIEITCLNVTCEYSKETYTANDSCGSGEWEVIGGTIVGGGSGTSWVDVYWDQVDPEDGFGYVSYSSHCGCPHWTTVKIPVVLVERAIIKGPDVICQGKQGKFTLPQWPTTDFKWRIDGDPNHPMLVLTDQRNEIMVDAMSPGGYIIEVDYRNTLLGGDTCRGTAKFYFNVVENVSILSKEPRTVCIGATNNFASSNGQPVNWQISLNNTIVHTATAVSTSYTFNTGGTYVVTANNNGCISDPVVVNVIPTPVITGSISGPNKVCLNVPYIYSISENEPGAIYVWSATGGTIIGSNAGTEVAAVFTSSGGAIHVVKQYVKNGVICQSATVDYKVTEVVVSPTIVNNEGLSQFCASDTYTFTADLGGIEVDHMEWQIVGTPPGAPETTNFGSITGGIHGNTVTVGINEITGGVINGELRLHVTKCGTKQTFTYPVNLLQLPNLSFTTDLNEYCPNAGVIFTVTTPGVALGNIAIYVDGILKEPNIGYTSGVPTGSIANLFDNPSDGNVQRRIMVEYLGGCKFNPKATKPVIVFPETKVTLSSPQTLLNLCFNPVQLYATLSVGLTGTETFEWYHNNQLVGANTDIHTINAVATEAGDYYVRVKDVNGCWSQSETITVQYDCGGGSGTPGQIGTPCGTDPNPSLTLTVEMTDCNTFEATLSGLTSGTPRWYGSEHVTLTSPQGTYPQVEYTVNELGFHWIRVEVDYGSCSTVREVMVTNYYEAGLKAKVSCNPNGNYTVILENNSRVHEPNSIVGNDIVYSYFRGATPLTTTTDANVSPGTYQYTIRVSAPNELPLVVCEKNITLVLPAKPNVDFLVPVANTEYCSEDPVTLEIQDFNPDNTYEWVFGGTSYKTDQQTTLINFSDEGSKSITLKATGPYGCTYETTTPVLIEINKATFTGALNTTALDFCEGSTVTPLQFNSTGSTAPGDAIWMRDNAQVHTGLTFTPTESGSYWPVLIDPNHGCKFYGMAEFPVIVTVRKPPFASINGNTSVCYGESTTLTGIYTDPAVEHRWTGPSLPAGYNNWEPASTGTPYLALQLSGLSPGNYTYAFETRLPGDPNCVNSFEVVVVFHPQLTTPSISIGLANCQPYTLQLSASGPAAGTYTWSNGMVGQTIGVTHGGAYSVTYTAPTGCSVTAQVQAPHNPERSLWIVPQGCYKICASLNPYLLAPLGVYDQYRWFVNGSTAQTGNNTFVPNIMINQSGDYQLAISQFGCTFYSNKPYIDLDYGCRAGSKPSQVKPLTTPAELTVSPNPATEVAVAAFNVGSQYQNATAIAVYDVTGVQRLQQKVSGKQGEVQLNISHLAAGTYMVNLQADGVNIAQQKLIKK